MFPQLLLLEIRTIWRTKRMRQLLLLNSFLVFISCINFILDSKRLWMNVTGKALIISLFAAGIMPFAFSKDGAFYQALQSRPMSFFRYVQAKYQVATFFCFLSFLLVHTFDLLAGKSYWGFNFALFTIGNGMILPLIIFAATYDRKRIDTSRSTFFNYEGVAWGRQSLATLPLLLFLIAPSFTIKLWSVLLAIGATALLLQNKIIAKIAALLERRKHTMLEGFRQ